MGYQLVALGVAAYYGCLLLLFNTAFHRQDVPISREFAVEAGKEATVLCPVQVGRLYSCYYGCWLKGTRSIANVPQPGRDCTPQDPMSPDGKYTIDRETFSLIITNAQPEDSGNYTCELMALNPASDFGTTVSYGGSIKQLLSVGGKFQ